MARDTTETVNPSASDARWRLSNSAAARKVGNHAQRFATLRCLSKLIEWLRPDGWSGHGVNAWFQRASPFR
jgi:hypothetical protein